MPSFDSPIGGKRFGGPAMREMEVPDEEGDFQSRPAPQSRRGSNKEFNMDTLQQLQAKLQGTLDSDNYEEVSEEQLRAAREQRRPGKERLNESARKRIEMLLGMTRMNREVAIGENTFVLQTLKSKEMSEAYSEAAVYDGTVQSPFEIRRQLLARSLVSISGIEFDQFISSRNLEDKLYFIDNQDHALLIRLYTEYTKLASESNERYAIKTVEDAKEVLEDLKK